MKALILIDIQIDFSPFGALPVKEGDQIVAVANELMSKFDWVVASKDWHPADHISFAANHPWRKPGQILDIEGVQQILWPIHCVQDSFGAHFIAGLNEENIDHIVYKGTNPKIDSYSAFYDNQHQKSTGLTEHLRSKNIQEIYIMGLATDYCVLFSALDAINDGFTVYLVEDGCRGIDMNAGDIDKAIQTMKSNQVQIIQSQAISI